MPFTRSSPFRKLPAFVGAVLSIALAAGAVPSAQATAATITKRKPVPVALPPAAGRFDYQLGGAYAPPARVTIVERDRSAAPARRSYGICYVNAYQTQPEELSWWEAKHPRLLLRTLTGYVSDPDWPDEVLLDTSTAAKRKELVGVVGSWIDGCAAKGFKAVEPDNLDSWTRSGGLLDSADNVAFARLLAARAHTRHLAIAQKNTADLASRGRSIGFDFAIAEECQVYGECDNYLHAYGSRVLEIEYTDNGLDAFTQACRARAHRISIILRDRDLVPKGQAGYTYSAC